MQKDPLTEYYKKSTSYADHLAGKDDSLFGYYKNAVCQFSNRNDKILDLGCGTGQSSYLISLEERNTVGLDISMFLLNKLNFRNPGYLDYVNGDILNLPFKRNSFDVVSAYAVLEHVLDVKKL